MLIIDDRLRALIGPLLTAPKPRYRKSAARMRSVENQLSIADFICCRLESETSMLIDYLPSAFACVCLPPQHRRTPLPLYPVQQRVTLKSGLSMPPWAPRSSDSIWGQSYPRSISLDCTVPTSTTTCWCFASRTSRQRSRSRSVDASGRCKSTC